MPRKPNRAATPDPATENFQRAGATLYAHPLFAPLYRHAQIIRQEPNLCPPAGWAVVTTNGYLHVHPKRRGEPAEWVYVLAHCLLHLGFGHLRGHPRAREWNAACDCFLARFLGDLKLGRPPADMQISTDFPARSEERLYEIFCAHGIPEHWRDAGTAGPGQPDMLFASKERTLWGRDVNWPECFATGLTQAVTTAVNVAGGLGGFDRPANENLTPARRARGWFVSSFPLLGALAAAFEIIEDPLVCARMQISVAAVDIAAKEIFINPAAGLDEYEARFVMAHELLHVGLRHDVRRLGRDPYLWNVACDYVVNGWLVEMGVGELPKLGALYDPELQGLSAEALYDHIVTDLRRFRKLATLRGLGACDMLERGAPDWWQLGDGVALDEFFRNCLSQGLVYHEQGGRGWLPAGLVEEIRALHQPPVPWDVQLAQWFASHFSPLEKRRTYARASRRQSATPDIPRPLWVPAHGAEDGRTYGVVLDTSGSMDRGLLARALGAVASYSIAREVPRVRVVFCDAATYDQGYLPPEAIADRVKVKGRGGTILQPAIDLLERAEDFPPDGPLLIITDGFCDRLRIRRAHAFLLPQGRTLPFVPKGPVFRLT